MTRHYTAKLIVEFTALVVLLITIVLGSIVGSITQDIKGSTPQSRALTQDTLKELERLRLLDRLPSHVLGDLIDHQWETGQSLAQILRDPEWCKKIGFTTTEFKCTWYVANPYQLLPVGLQDAIRKRKTPLYSRVQVWQWCRANKFPSVWRDALSAALIETTPQNLWRASHGKRPFANNGQFLEPIVVDYGKGNIEVREGHIATDPKVIPTNSTVYLLLRVNNVDKILKVRAADIGSGIRGTHVDLPVHVGPGARRLPYTVMPKAIRNSSVQILTIS